MNKKILALALAIVFIATAFTACKKGPELTEINGSEYPLATNNDGETIINDENKIAVLVTDRDNEVLTYSDGENQTYWLPINGPIIVEDRIQSGDYTLGIPSGWEGNEISGKVIKNGTDGKCYIKCAKMKKIDKETTSLGVYLETIDAQDTAIAEAFSDEEAMNKLAETTPEIKDYIGCKYTLSKSTGTIASKLNCEIRVHKIVDKDGKVIHYAENYYFVSGKAIYKLEYACVDGKGYDESFSFRNYIGQAFTFNVK